MFFTAINQMMTKDVDLTMVIRKSNNGLTVSVLPKSNTLKDEAQNHIVPLTVSGLPQELDAGFLNAVCRPVQKANGLITNMAQFEAQANKAASTSKAAKDAKAKETKEEKEKREKYEKHLKKAEELIAANNHKDAVTALTQARLYAKEEDRKKIDEMLETQKKAMNQGSLFELMEEAAPQAQPQPQNAADKPVVPQPQQMFHQQPAQQPMPQPQAVPVQPQPVQYPQDQPQQYRPQPQYRQPQQGGYAPPMNGQQPGQQAYAGNRQPPYIQEQPPMPYEMVQPDVPPVTQPAYRPEDYGDYPDFPVSMLQDQYVQPQMI